MADKIKGDLNLSPEDNLKNPTELIADRKKLLESSDLSQEEKTKIEKEIKKLEKLEKILAKIEEVKAKIADNEQKIASLPEEPSSPETGSQTQDEIITKNIDIVDDM